MKRTCITILLFLLSFGSLAETPQPLCVLSPAAMPGSWRPWGDTQKSLSNAPWSPDEAEDSLYAIRKGLDEITGLYERRPSAVMSLWDDAVASVIEVTYSAINTPDIDRKARDAARRYLAMLVEPYLRRQSGVASCEEFELLLPLTFYTRNFHGDTDPRLNSLTVSTNSAYRACDTVNEAVDTEYQQILSAERAPADDVFDLVIWSIWFTEAELIPGLELPSQAREFPLTVWRFLETYRLIDATAYPDGAWNEEFIDTAYLATHIAYIPTGIHRHPIYIEDSPELYRFLRENFYAVLEMGELDLVAEFVDSFRQYGCTEQNDLQVRDGTRYLLKLFHAGGDQWMTYREPGETDEDVDDYDAVHKAWTAMLGLRVRVLEPVQENTYGAVVRRWLPHPR